MAPCVHVAGRTRFGLAGVLSTVTMGVTLRSGTCGRVNSIKETPLERALLEHSKFRIKRFATMLFEFHCVATTSTRLRLCSRLLKCRELRLGQLISEVPCPTFHSKWSRCSAGRSPK